MTLIELCLLDMIGEKKLSSLREKLIKNSTIEFTDTLIDSKIFTKKDIITTPVPMINVALSGTIDGGITPGVTMLAGPSKHFKTGFALLLCQAFLNKYPEGIILFYDAEFGTPQSYFKAFNIPFDHVIHTPITDLEELKFDLMRQLKELVRGEKVMIVLDSLGQLASKKEVDDALDGKSTADMTRAKQIKSLFRMVTPHLSLKDIPFIIVNHTYKEIGMYPRDVVGGGTGAAYGPDNTWIIGRQQEKGDEGITGYHFIINVEKSRFVKEKSKIPISISYSGGINKWSGLLDVAIEGGYIVKPKAGWYAVVDQETGEVKQPSKRAADIIDNDEFWWDMLESTNLAQHIETRYKLPHALILDEEKPAAETKT